MGNRKKNIHKAHMTEEIPKSEHEYLMLREEILMSMEIVKNYRSLLYTIVVAILAFGFDKGNPWLFLIPFAAIIPLYLLAMHQIDSTLRIGAYIYVFLEPVMDIKWETNLYEYDRLHKNQYSTKKSSIDPYVVMSICCIVLSVVNLDFSNICRWDMFGCIVAQMILLVYSLWCFKTKHIDYLKTKEKYIEEWEMVKGKIKR